LAYKMNRMALSHDAKGLGKRSPDTKVAAAERLSELTIPVLAIVGDQDIPYILAAADYMVDKIPSAQKVIIEDAAHLPNMDHPNEFQQSVIEFLEGATL
jgi:pimeloyl-ACP methyl ester carboxylesterase